MRSFVVNAKGHKEVVALRLKGFVIFIGRAFVALLKLSKSAVQNVLKGHFLNDLAEMVSETINWQLIDRAKTRIRSNFLSQGVKTGETWMKTKHFGLIQEPQNHVGFNPKSIGPPQDVSAIWRWGTRYELP